ncbi:MAG: hypothetical protein KAR13_11905, partial [Desulfobulbaceae bacterium]|nr:hypothetical protein [Desulfobulbaceae bacterium]
GTCYDDGYASGTNYAGYFTRDTWYVYDFIDNRFEPQTTSDVAKTVCTEAVGTQYNNDDPGTDDVCITINTTTDPDTVTDTVTAFAAKGNFLNWVAASKFDIEKKILTGGKWNSDNSKLIMESRGCGGTRFIKKLALDDGKYLTLAVKPRSGTDHTTQIEIFQVNDTGFDNTDCQDVLDEMAKDIPNLGQIKVEIDGCMEYGANQSYTGAENPAFNQAIQSCWWADKHGSWPDDGAQHVISLKNQCFTIYGTIDPEDIATDSSGYVCYGKYGAAEESAGYVGRCWEPAGGDRDCNDRSCATDGHVEGDTWKIIGTDYKCEGGIVKEYINSKKVWATVQDCVGGGDISGDGWTNDIADFNGDEVIDADEGVDVCVDQALRDFCEFIPVPQVIDPSDLESSTGEIWNIPAMLIDSGVIGQLDQPIATIDGYIYEPTAPEGIIQEFADDLHMGVMRFNIEGSKSECTLSDPYVLYSCVEEGNRDGGIVIVDIDQGDDHTTTLVSAINNMEADTWTPLAEAMYNAIGYYGQNNLFRLDNTDFTINAGVDPVKYWCQDNNVLIITEGASTADLNVNVAVAANDYDADNDDSPDPCFDSNGDDNVDANDISACNALSAGTYLDDMTYFGWHGAVTDIYTTPTLNDRDKQNIKTHIVATGTLRDTGDTECSPDVLMLEAAANGGTTLYNSDDAAALEDNLRQVFSEIRSGASAGSAASVISSSRGGEGAIYQAIFWP